MVTSLKKANIKIYLNWTENIHDCINHNRILHENKKKCIEHCIYKIQHGESDLKFYKNKQFNKIMEKFKSC